FEKKQAAAPPVDWVPLAPASMKPLSAVKLIPQEDRSILVTGSGGKGILTVTTRTNLRGITAFRLEVLAHERLPKGGPGLSPDGNFVLAEFEVTAAPADKPEQAQPVKLQNPLADFSQRNYPVATLIDNDPNNSETGWAVSPAFGVTHWATFDTKEPIDIEGGT